MRATNLPIQIQQLYCKSPCFAALLIQRLNLPGVSLSSSGVVCFCYPTSGLFRLFHTFLTKYWSFPRQSALLHVLMKELDGRCQMPDVGCHSKYRRSLAAATTYHTDYNSFVHDLITQRCKMALTTCQSGACCNYQSCHQIDDMTGLTRDAPAHASRPPLLFPPTNFHSRQHHYYWLSWLDLHVHYSGCARMTSSAGSIQPIQSADQHRLM